jgi:hypothetical protein
MWNNSRLYPSTIFPEGNKDEELLGMSDQLHIQLPRTPAPTACIPVVALTTFLVIASYIVLLRFLPIIYA